MLGMIVPATPGSATRWALEDLHSRVPLDVESCRRMPGLYTESCIVLVQGRLDEDGVFRAWNVGMPPPEARTDSLLALGVVDQYQVSCPRPLQGQARGPLHRARSLIGWPLGGRHRLRERALASSVAPLSSCSTGAPHAPLLSPRSPATHAPLRSPRSAPLPTLRFDRSSCARLPSGRLLALSKSATPRPNSACSPTAPWTRTSSERA